LLYAMGEDRLAPRALGAVHRRYHTPALAILVMAGWACILVLAAAVLTRSDLPILTAGRWTIDLNMPKDKSVFDVLTDFAMFGAVIFETMAVLTIFVFRWRMPDAERPYRCPGYPLVPALYVILPAFLLGNMFFRQRLELLTGVVFICLGAVVYLFISARHSDRSVPID
ncbi:MAG TPA: amino acid permease, partial [Gemmataceae bacterium]|nr:amino acid permease [Gemmataceae bacterium]